MEDVYLLRYEKLRRYVDYVIYVKNSDECDLVVQAAIKYNVALIPFGAGTNVQYSVNPLANEKRSIASVDTTRMNHI